MDEMQNQGGMNPAGETKSPAPKPTDAVLPKPSNLVTIVTVVLVVALIIIISNAIREKQVSENPEENNLSVEVLENYKEDENGVVISEPAAEFSIPENFGDRERAERIINSTQGKNAFTVAAEYIQANIINDPKDAETFYFATATPNLTENFGGIYKYNSNTGFWQRLYKATFNPNKEGTTLMLRVVGQDGRNLIVAYDELNTEPEACESLLLRGADSANGLFSINIDKPAGLTNYELSASLRQSEAAKQTACAN